MAQFKKGDKILGASVGSIFFNTGTSDQVVTSIGSTTAKITGFGISISPSSGWFISDNTAIGVLVNISPSGQKTTYEQNGSTFQKDKLNNFSIGTGGFIRSYFSHSGSFLPFGQAGINGGINSLKTDGFFYGGSGTSVYKQTYTGNSSGGFFANASFNIGVTKMLGESTGLDLYIGYTFSYTKNTFNKTTLIDRMIDGTIDETLKNETTTKFTNHGFTLGAAFQIFLKKRK